MLTGKYYYWIDNQVVEKDPPRNKELLDTLCVDDCTKLQRHRYGMYTLMGPEKLWTWKTIPLKDFPKDFQMALMLLGVE